MDQWLISSIGGCLKEGKLPSVPAERTLEQCLFPARLHPRYSNNLDKQLLNAWAKAYGSTWAQDIQKMGSHDFGGLAAYFWPSSTDDKRTITLIKLMLWFFLLDDANDDLSALQANRLANRLLRVLFSADMPAHLGLGGNGGHEREPAAHEKEPLLIATGLEWWNEMKGSISPKQKARFAVEFTKFLLDQAAFEDYKEKLVSDAAANITTRPGFLEEYIKVRREASGFTQCLTMVEYDVGIELGEETLRNPLLQQLHDAVSDRVSWLNDILSFPKEFARGDLNNLVPLLHMRNNEGGKQVAFEEAVSEAWQMVYEREQECARLAHELLHHQDSAAGGHLAARRQPGFEMYVNTVCGQTAGIWAWSLQSRRYEVHTSAVLAPTRRPRSLALLHAPKAAYNALATPSLFATSAARRPPGEVPHIPAAFALPSCFVKAVTGASTIIKVGGGLCDRYIMVTVIGCGTILIFH